MQEFITNSLGYPLRISALAVDPNNSNTVVAGTYAYGIGGAAAPITTSGVYISANAGKSWNQCVITAPSMPTTSTQWISDLVLDNSTNPTTIYAAIGQSNLSGYDNANPANGIYTANHVGLASYQPMSRAHQLAVHSQDRRCVRRSDPP